MDVRVVVNAIDTSLLARLDEVDLAILGSHIGVLLSLFPLIEGEGRSRNTLLALLAELASHRRAECAVLVHDHIAVADFLLAALEFLDLGRIGDHTEPDVAALRVEALGERDDIAVVVVGHRLGGLDLSLRIEECVDITRRCSSVLTVVPDVLEDDSVVTILPRPADNIASPIRHILVLAELSLRESLRAEVVPCVTLGVNNKHVVGVRIEFVDAAINLAVLEFPKRSLQALNRDDGVEDLFRLLAALFPVSVVFVLVFILITELGVCICDEILQGVINAVSHSRLMVGLLDCLSDEVVALLSEEPFAKVLVDQATEVADGILHPLLHIVHSSLILFVTYLGARLPP